MLPHWRASRLVVVATVGLAGAVAFAVPAVFGRGPDSKSAAHIRGQGGSWDLVANSAAHTKRGLKFVYVRGSKTINPGAFFGAPLKCPAKYPHPISSFFDSDSEKVVLTQDRPEPQNGPNPRRVRQWSIGTTNFDSVPAGVTGGIICTK